MRFWIRLVSVFALAMIAAFAVALYLAIDREPMVRRAAEITPGNIKRAKQILDQNTPRRLQASGAQSVTLSEQDLDLVANYLAHFYANGSARLKLTNDKAEIVASIRPPQVPLIFYFNVSAVVGDGAAVPRFRQISIGRLVAPGFLADWLAAQALKKTLGQETLVVLAQAIKQVDIKDGQLAIAYERPANLRDKLRSAVVSVDDQERLRVYQERLALISGGSKDKSVSLTELLVALFELAEARAAQGNSPAENRAVITVLALYVTGKPLSALLPAAKDWPRPSAQVVTLNGREDLAKHFIVSAALAVNVGVPVSDAAGLHKEIEDSRSGSGFSFADLAADRAGTRFGAYAVEQANATKLQKKLAAGASERDFMPGTEELPKSMSETEFKRRFGGVGASPYTRMAGDIDRRIAQLRLYR
jgi:hypothetical protein